jgi:Tfp pilus assembly protein PilX
MCCSRTTPSRRAEAGFVLATTLLVTTLLTVMLAASFLLVSAEQRTTDNSFGTAQALSIAQAGLQNYFARNSALTDTSTYDSARVTLTGGYADVVAHRVRPGQTSGGVLALWVVRSAGVATGNVLSGQTQGSRTIAQFAQLNIGILPARAAMVALNGVQVTGNGQNSLSGDDLGAQPPCTPPAGAAADTAALSVPASLNGSDLGNGPGPTGSVETFPAWNNLYDSTHIDWASLIAGNFNADYTIPPAAYPGFSGSYNIYMVQGDATVPAGQRRGFLVVTGNVTMAAGAHWDGIILAGGNVSAATGNSAFIIHGMIVTGLNEALGQSVPANQLKRGNATVQWTWCYTQSSVNSLASMVPIKNAWADTWTTY